MAEDFALKKVPQSVVDAVNGANNAQDLRENMLQSMTVAGIITPRTRDDAFNVRLVPQPPERSTPSAALPVNAAPPTCIRVVYPGGNDRFELFGASEAELDAKEQKLRAMYEGQR